MLKVTQLLSRKPSSRALDPEPLHSIAFFRERLVWPNTGDSDGLACLRTTIYRTRATPGKAGRAPLLREMGKE